MPLDELTPDDAAAFADDLVELHRELDSYFLVRFAPEMNGTWYGWGQQPRAYVEAFRTLADEVHAATPHAAMVWAPVYGAGYPYGAAYGDVDPDRMAEAGELDTNDNGRLDEGDDPYGPYWPGDDVVDWVGLTLYHFGPDRGRVDNDLGIEDGGETGDLETSEGFELDRAATPEAYRERLEERFNYNQGTGGTPSTSASPRPTTCRCSSRPARCGSPTARAIRRPPSSRAGGNRSSRPTPTTRSSAASPGWSSVVPRPRRATGSSTGGPRAPTTSPRRCAPTWGPTGSTSDRSRGCSTSRPPTRPPPRGGSRLRTTSAPRWAGSSSASPCWRSSSRWPASRASTCRRGATRTRTTRATSGSTCSAAGSSSPSSSPTSR
ncbi:hypothetical protein [Nocardioides zeae]